MRQVPVAAINFNASVNASPVILNSGKRAWIVAMIVPLSPTRSREPSSAIFRRYFST
ncbi:MAG: hypothetical protein H0T76_16685 [Nannocystis sp.]|nr:hypothetical protein [Nannocystis sp.]MBA3548120.1 hypothetical protein [Nannocystis sp.]